MSLDFPFPRPRAPAEKSAWYKQLLSWSKTARPVKQLVGLELQINVPCTEYQPPPALPPTANWNGHQLSQRQVPARFLDPDVNSVYLVKPLRAGKGWMSQVWAASFDPACTDADAPLAVKIYQSSWHPVVTRKTLNTNPHPRLYDKFYEYRSEARAYAAFAPLQGSFVPYVRGFYKIELPHGEPAPALVMERIRKRKVSHADFPTVEHAARIFDRDRCVITEFLFAQAKGLLDAVFAFGACGIYTLNFSVNNVLWPIDREPDSHPVFVGFTFATAAPTNGDMCRQVIRCLETLRQYDFDLHSIMRYVREAIAPGGEIARRLEILPQYKRSIVGIVGSKGWVKDEEYETDVANA